MTLPVCIITHTGSYFTGDKLGAALELESVKLFCQVKDEWIYPSMVQLHGNNSIFTLQSFLL
jgi:hypothetical protein